MTERAARGRPIKVGIGLPDAEGIMDGSTAGWSEIMNMAVEAERLGFDSVWNQDHLLFHEAPWMEPGDPSEGIWECWSILAAIAAVTNRVEIGPLVSCTSFRNPALLAKIAETIDEISGGRLILGIGAGWHESEYSAFGFPFDHRVSRFEESLTIIHGLLRLGTVDVDGAYVSARNCDLRPRGPRPTGPPIMIGTRGERMLRLAARYADRWNGYFSNGQHRPEELGPVLAAVDAACVAEGRDPRSLARSFAVFVDLDGDAPFPSSVSTSGSNALMGTTKELAEIFRGYAEIGIDHLQVLVHPMTIDGIRRLAPVLIELDAD